MSDQPIFSIGPAVFAVCLVILSAVNYVFADTQQTEGINSFYKALSERVEKGVRGPAGGWHYYWKDGYFSIDSRKENIKFRINGQFIVDAGNIDADDELQDAFPELDSSECVL